MSTNLRRTNISSLKSHMEGSEARRMNSVVHFVFAICDVLCLVSVQAQQLDLQGLIMEAFAKSAKMPYAELAGAWSWDENL